MVERLDPPSASWTSPEPLREADVRQRQHLVLQVTHRQRPAQVPGTRSPGGARSAVWSIRRARVRGVRRHDEVVDVVHERPPAVESGSTARRPGPQTGRRCCCVGQRWFTFATSEAAPGEEQAISANGNGFSKATFTWLAGLESDNTTTWFHENRDDYGRLVELPFIELLEDVSARLRGTAVPLQGGQAVGVAPLLRLVARADVTSDPYRA